MKKHMTREGDIFKESLKLCLICASSVMIQKDLFWYHGGFDENLPTCEDYDLWLKITAQHKIGFVNKNLVSKFGGHSDQLSKKYKMMDQYRVQSLKNLLKNKNLSETKVEFVKDEIKLKLSILEI
jgi:GT2 family glycosyltransferase